MAISGGSGLLLMLFISAISVIISAAEPPSLNPDGHQQMDRIIEAMIGTGDFRDWAGDFLSAVNDQFGIPLSATLFIPDSFDAASVTVAGGAADGRLTLAYHVVPRRLAFSDLLLMKPLTRLPTLLPETSIVVTNNSASGFAIDGVRVSSPDLFLSSSIAIHGVASPLDLSLPAGGRDGTFGGSLLPRTRKDHANSGSACFPVWFLFPVVMAVVSAVKIRL
ncbi:PREDICTED: FAS1 domain-containing protein SELMODRAFT_448915-like [Tarenaya hassleriana]|uniref:FAS1 domain-containing protein SELMODRAFT_448915-like n=1 Tax=Tarenaya hassleriana TaxID=28532 RepID=UPI00053C5A15|nr:PREDICTED: FAS1 domain-containing protein SELMODRAFT_448915-like [Tarenaya hassleriana]